MKKIVILILLLGTAAITAQQQNPYFKIARLKYNGGGDWYNDPSAEVNLLRYVEENTTIKTDPEYRFVDIATDDLFSYPFIFITGHGNFTLSESEADKLREYMEAGGFVYVDDDYGLYDSFTREIKKVFPDRQFAELPFSHEIYHSFYDFEYGPPKTHEHDNKNPQGFGIFIGERLALYYTLESNPSDGWADPRAHEDSPKTREEALKFGTNLVVYVLTGQGEK